jgi:hypothetical protein
VNPSVAEVIDDTEPESCPRPRTVAADQRLSRAERAAFVSYPEGVERPRTRGECTGGPSPCPFVSCKHHLYIDVNRFGGLKFNFPGIELEEMAETCALDVADRGGATLEEVGAILNLTRERIRQVEFVGLGRLHEEVDKNDVVDG